VLQTEEAGLPPLEFHGSDEGFLILERQLTFPRKFRVAPVE
jgi:hypothetical protein